MIVKNSTNINKTSKKHVYTHINPLNIRKTTPYDVGNLALGLEYAEKCGGVKPENGTPDSPSL